LTLKNKIKTKTHHHIVWPFPLLSIHPFKRHPSNKRPPKKLNNHPGVVIRVQCKMNLQHSYHRILDMET